MENILTISELNKRIKILLEENFSELTVQGEISNFTAHSSGHWYFSLKDENCQISCVMWRSRNQSVFFTPENGMKVIVIGRLTVYEVRGNYQIETFIIKPLGQGELLLAFENLKKKLESEGLFDQKHKKKIPSFPKKIGIVTSREGAALRDVIAVFKRRYPIADLYISSAQVQGAGASLDIKRAIELLNEFGDLDVIILCRGGGSIEDLWAFNEEITARAIFNSKIPIVSGVGHEVDITISDYVADLRAATPTAAAELITPNLRDVKIFLDENLQNLNYIVDKTIQNFRDYLTGITKSYSFSIPYSKVKTLIQKLDYLFYKFDNSFNKQFNNLKQKFNNFDKTIKLSDPDKILEKGFTYIKQNGKIISDKNLLEKNKKFIIRFKNGEIFINETDEK